MPALDRFHTVVANVLVADGWTITHNPLRLRYGQDDVYVDLGAEKGTVKVAVVVRGFTDAPPLTELADMLGRLLICREVLALSEPERVVYMAVPQWGRERVFSEGIGALMLHQRIKNLVTFDPERETVVQWLP